jgi:hypothetical protein
MSITTLLRYLVGSREAILAIAGNRHAEAVRRHVVVYTGHHSLLVGQGSWSRNRIPTSPEAAHQLVRNYSDVIGRSDSWARVNSLGNRVTLGSANLGSNPMTGNILRHGMPGRSVTRV